MQIWVNKDNTDYGPYSLEELQKYVKDGSISPNDSACEVGSSSWSTVGEILPSASPKVTSPKKAKPIQKTPPPPPQSFATHKQAPASFTAKPKKSSRKQPFGWAVCFFIAFVLIVVGFFVVKMVRNVHPGVFDSATVTKVTVKAGDVTITDREDDGLSHIKIECNNGLIIEADWERNFANDFGYDIYEPEVNMDYNRLAIMITARSVIANYLKGQYD